MSVTWLEDVGDGENRRVGKKASSLAALRRAGLDVPRGFVVTAPTFEEVVRRNDLEDRVQRVLQDADRDDLGAMRRAANRIRSMLTDMELPDETREDIEQAYENINMAEEVRNAGGEAVDLVGGQRETEFVAVRSSPTGARIPGAHESRVNVNGKDSLVDAIRSVWASLYSVEALAVEDAFGEIHSMGVVVQRMVEPDVSAAAFNHDPRDGGDVVVESLWGLGTALGEGSATPDRYVLDRDGVLQEEQIANKGWKIVRDPTSGKTMKQRVSSGEREARTLDDRELSDVLDAVREAERVFSGNIVLDLAISRDRVHVLDVAESSPVAGGGGEAEGIVRGTGASGGTASGPVNLVYGDTDIETVAGDEVVATVDAAERFAAVLDDVAAVVADEGGIASNLSLLARRLEVPCVVGTGNGTDMLTKGETVTVNGRAGTVAEGEVREDTAEPAVQGPGEPAEPSTPLLTATRVTALGAEAAGAEGVVLPDYTPRRRAERIAREHHPEPVWIRTDRVSEDNLGVLAEDGEDVDGRGVILRSYGGVMRSPDLLARGAAFIAVDVPALEEDGGSEALANAIEKVGSEADGAETAVILDRVDPGHVAAAVEHGIDTVAVPAHLVPDARRAVAQAERRFMLDRLRDL